MAKAEDGGFEIVGEGDIVQHYQVDGKEREITYTHALHTPTLNANLVSVSALDKAGLTTIFANGKGVIQNPSFAMTSLSQPTSLEQWHQRLVHCSPLTIQEMSNKGLVDELIISDKVVNGKCEDRILGCQTC